MSVVEVFKSIDGEGTRTGAPTIFIRFAGCNLRCAYCDTAYAFNASDADPKYATAEAVANSVKAMSVENHINNITITGGEPLLHPKEIIKILDYLSMSGMRYDINIETNGTIIPDSFTAMYNKSAFATMYNSDGSYSNSLFYTFDLKTASAGEYEREMCLDVSGEHPKFANIELPIHGDKSVIKSVVGSQEDLKYVRDIYNNGSSWRDNYAWYVSPVFGDIEPCELVDFVLANPELNEWKVQVQLHKIIWDPMKRGV